MRGLIVEWGSIEPRSPIRSSSLFFRIRPTLRYAQRKKAQLGLAGPSLLPPFKKARARAVAGSGGWGSLTMTYFRAVYPALSSALRRFTVLFGMGRRGTNALWSSEKRVGGRPWLRAPSGILVGGL